MSLSTEKILTEIWALLRGGIPVTSTPAPGGSNNSTITSPLGQQTMANSVGVVLASNQSDVPVKGASLEMAALSAGALNADLVPSTDVNGYKWFSLQVLGTWSGTITTQGSNDNVNFESILNWQLSAGANGNSTDSSTVTITTNRIAMGFISFRYLRVRMTSYTSGTATGVLELYSTPPAITPPTRLLGINGTIIPGTAATNLGKAEDVAHASGDTGVMALAVRNDANAAIATTDLDYTPIGVDSAGRIGRRPFTYGRVTADGQIKATPGVLHTLTIAATGVVTGGVLTIYDSATESGTVILSVLIPSSLTIENIMLHTSFLTALFVGYDATLANVQVTCTFT